MAVWIDTFVHQAPLAAIFLATAVFFLAIYFAYAAAALALTRRLLPALGIGRVIDTRPLRPNQIQRELRLSLVSIAVFGVLTVIQALALRAGWIQLDWQAPPTAVALQTLALLLWNELHFYACHWLLHRRWLYRHVHRVHHEFVVPTPFSTYAFHWAEAALLGSVMLLATLAWDFHPLALALLPLLSLLFNTIGHANYDVFAGARRSASLEHARHHRLVGGNYGFYLPWFDRLFRTHL